MRWYSAKSRDQSKENGSHQLGTRGYCPGVNRHCTGRWASCQMLARLSVATAEETRVCLQSENEKPREQKTRAWGGTYRGQCEAHEV